MPRASKRKTAPPNSSSVQSDGGRPAGKAKTRGKDKIDKLFDSYANSSLGVIDPEGIEKLCSDLGVDHTNIRILMFAWKVGAAKQGYFTLDEWRTGLKALRTDTIPKLKKALPELEKEVNTPAKFMDFYSFSFRYCLTEEKQKSVDIETICELLNLVLGSQYRQQVDSLIEYLKIQNDYKGINLDQWTNFFRFFNEIHFPNLQNYDAAEAWPLILDNFVEWMKEKEG
ncbi:DCN1-like protein 4 isoform X2 [Carica papaya]|uniref:DCN1-like protein 4 isoform X2 n=1 Tax=Carica papaya TaxID=3649 RepID=UPI000B8C8972|nr:DCN1-like protein 4 isoform X2 [Carica papaya]